MKQEKTVKQEPKRNKKIKYYKLRSKDNQEEYKNLCENVLRHKTKNS